MTDTIDTIRPIITETYGRSAMAYALVANLADKIDAYAVGDDHYDGREDMIRQTCWNWFSGGTTAETVAKEVEAALNG